MNDDLLRRVKLKQKALWWGLGVLTAPTIPFQALLNLSQAIENAKALLGPAKDPPCPSLNDLPDIEYFTTLAPHDPLKKWAESQARKEAVETLEIFYLPKYVPVQNAYVCSDEKKMIIVLQGNPHLHEDIYNKVIVGHEIGHFNAGASLAYNALAFDGIKVYTSLALIGMISTSLGALVNALTYTLTSQGAAVNFNLASGAGTMLSYAGAYALAYGASKFSKSTEHLADLKAAEMTSPEEFKDVMQEVVEENPTHDKKESWVEHMLLLFDTHPPLQERIHFIQKAFGRATLCAAKTPQFLRTQRTKPGP